MFPEVPIALVHASVRVVAHTELYPAHPYIRQMDIMDWVQLDQIAEDMSA